MLLQLVVTENSTPRLVFERPGSEETMLLKGKHLDVGVTVVGGEGAGLTAYQACVGIYSGNLSRIHIDPARDSLRCEETKVDRLAGFAWTPLAPMQFSGMASGKHTIWALLYDEGRATVQGAVDIRRVEILPTSFQPSYSWERVYPQQSIPPGLEVRLDLGGSGMKTARIPQTWRIQVWVDEVARFLRVDLTATTQVTVLLTEAAKMTGVSLSCVDLVRKDDSSFSSSSGSAEREERYQPWETVADARLFEDQHLVHFQFSDPDLRPECVVHRP